MVVRGQGDFEVRRAQPHEVGVLAELGMAIQRLHADGRPEVFRESDLLALREFFDSQFTPELHVLLAVVGKEPVGYPLAEHFRREANAFKHRSSILHPSHRRCRL